MSKSLLHDWESSIEKNKNNTEELLKIAEDIYNTAYARGKASTERPQSDLISRSALKEKLAKCGYDIVDFGGLFFIIDNAPTVCGNNPKWCESCVSNGKCASTRPNKNYIDEKGNYHNIENFTLAQIYDSGVEEGYRIAKQEGERVIAQVNFDDDKLKELVDELAERIKKGEFLLYDFISGDDFIESENKEE